MLKHIITLATLALLTVGVYLFKFGLPVTPSDYANLGSFSGGTFVALATVYGVLYAIWHNISSKKENESSLIDAHLNLMKTYKTAHTGGYSGDGYAFLNWLWPHTVNQLTAPPTREAVIANSNLKEMAQWLRSVKKCGNSRATELVQVMSPIEVKLAQLYLTISELPKSYRAPISKKIADIELNDKEKALLSL
ncbi:hypothetical protein PH586_08525 [Pseudomonas sp. SA3-5]|uniref:DUF4760 domain-containing protein n=1 Tax=Pseudomonas aestuarii TaxID=3018340 RepID=A0ABT4XDZ1_9PSED|nr:hypothetical protein [Pseudomonas aestuarii]MDA7086421.1 hypothetical protein [Pseudomonas aestuarii]